MRRFLVHRWVFRKLRRDDGQAAFEFLLMFPALVILLLLFVDLGVMMYEQVSVSNAVREGARYASVNCGGNCGAAAVESRTIARSSGFLSGSDDIRVHWTDVNGNGIFDRGESVQVCATHTYDFLFFPALSIDVKSRSEMRLEQKETNTTGNTAC